MPVISLAKKLLLATIILSLIIDKNFADSNHLGFGFENHKKSVTIPIRVVKNLVILEAILDNEAKLNLILDTGVRSLVLFHKSYVPVWSENTFDIKFSGAGVQSPISAKVSTGHNLRLSMDVVANQINTVILNRSNHYLHEISGIKIHGIFGYQLFTRFQVKIDFKKQQLTLSEPNITDDMDDFYSIPLIIHDTKPFLKIHAMGESGKWYQLQMILDLGANHKILLHQQYDTDSLITKSHTNKRIAEGLNGAIHGNKASLGKVKIGNKLFHDTEVLIPSKKTYHQESMKIKKHGSLGCKFFSQSVIIIDYINMKLYFKDIRMTDESQNDYMAKKINSSIH